jgi:predicted 3-demethylubiquinone-9 3-methyltransferase (glyoxalase superfamily)
MQKICPFLWFDNQAEKAMNHYVSIFKNSKVGKITRYREAGPGFCQERPNLSLSQPHC